MNLQKQILTANECYKVNRAITVEGIMVHSTGANNPNLKRYVGPDDGLLGNNPNNNHWNQFRPDGRQVCVHAFIGKLADGSIATYQTLPWNIEAWHGGSGVKGRVNDTHIGFEICEDGLSDANYFNAVYQEAVEFCAYLCKEFKLDPLADGVLICHSEGCKRGIATNHADVTHWFPKFGKTMDMFRSDVKKQMDKASFPSTPAPKLAGESIMGKSVLTAEQISAFLLSKNPAPLVIKCTPLELAKLYLSEGNIEGVRGDIAFAQAIQETGWFRFGKDVQPEQNNYCGYGATNTTAKGKGAWFTSPQAGVRCHIQHLKAYGSKDTVVNPLVQPLPPVENRFKYVTRSIAPSWTDLNGKWAVPGYDTKAYASFDAAYDAGATYGQKILAIYADMAAFKVTATATKYYKVQIGAYGVKSNADAMLAKVKAVGFADAYVTPIGADKLYRVQVGAFSQKNNADILATKLKAAGFDAFVKYE